MNKKLLLILSTLFLIGLLSVSCSNEDKTGTGGEDTTGSRVPTEIAAKYNGTYAAQGNSAFIVVKEGFFGMGATEVEAGNPPNFPMVYEGEIFGSDPNYEFESSAVAGTLTFTDSSVTIIFTKNSYIPNDQLGKPATLNKQP